MRISFQASIILLAILAICVAACGGAPGAAPTPTPAPTPHAPTADSLPDGWWLSVHVEYGQIIMPGEPTTGFMKYTPTDYEASIYIQYGDIPSWALEYTDDIETLFDEFLAQSNTSCCGGYTPDEVGTMTLCGVPAAYAGFSLPDSGLNGIAAMCIKDNVMIAVDATWLAEDKENEVMSIIGNLSY
jgi:hypothetical protein